MKIRCNAPALASGAVLVDLPTSYTLKYADTQIARPYEEVDHTWIVTQKHDAANRIIKGLSFKRRRGLKLSHLIFRIH